MLGSDLDYATAGEGVGFGRRPFFALGKWRPHYGSLNRAMLTLGAGLGAGSIECNLKQSPGAPPPRRGFFMSKRGGEVTINGGESS